MICLGKVTAGILRIFFFFQNLPLMWQLQSSQKETHNYGEHLVYLIKSLFTTATLRCTSLPLGPILPRICHFYTSVIYIAGGKLS